MWSGRDINPFSIDSFAEHTRAAGHGQWMDDYRPVEITGQKPSKEMRCGPGNKQAIMICKKVLWLKSKECWVAKWQFIRLRSVSSMTCKHEMRTQRFPLDEVNSNFQVPHVHYPSISDRLVPK